MNTNPTEIDLNDPYDQETEVPVEQSVPVDENDKVIIVVSNVLLVLGCLLSIAVFCIGFYTWHKFDFTAALSAFMFGLVGVFITLIQWLFLRVATKISRRLSVLEKKLEK